MSRLQRQRYVRLAPLCGLLLLVGCTAPAAQQEGPPAEPAGAAEATAPAVSLWSRDGLEEQSRLQELTQRTPPELDHRPGTTGWRAADLALPARLTQPGPDRPESPGALLYEVVRAAGWADRLGGEAWEQTLRVWRDGDEPAVGVALQWGMQDDSVAGHDLRVRMERAEGGWHVTAVEERFHCSRGVTEDDICL